MRRKEPSCGLKWLSDFKLAFCYVIGVCLLGEAVTTFYQSYNVQRLDLDIGCRGHVCKYVAETAWIVMLVVAFFIGVFRKVAYEGRDKENKLSELFLLGFISAAAFPVAWYLLEDYISFAPQFFTSIPASPGNRMTLAFLPDLELTQSHIERGCSRTYYSWRSAVMGPDLCSFHWTWVDFGHKFNDSGPWFYWVFRALENVFEYIPIIVLIAFFSSIINSSLYPKSYYFQRWGSLFFALNSADCHPKTVRDVNRVGIIILMTTLIYNGYNIWSLLSLAESLR